MYEINANLYGSGGLKNIDIFSSEIKKVIEYFTEKLLMKFSIDLYIDNATECCGHVPITTKVFDKFIIIKLGINESRKPQDISKQFSHELMHYYFYELYGMDRIYYKSVEEGICEAASLIYIKDIYPIAFDSSVEYSSKLRGGYESGPIYAKQAGYKLENLPTLYELYVQNYK